MIRQLNLDLLLQQLWWQLRLRSNLFDLNYLSIKLSTQGSTAAWEDIVVFAIKLASAALVVKKLKEKLAVEEEILDHVYMYKGTIYIKTQFE